jgi:proteasome lid subunit RPN8/RPN11
MPRAAGSGEGDAVTEPDIFIGWEAWNDLLAIDWRDDIERAAGLLGHAKPDGSVHVEHVTPSRRFVNAGPNWVKPDPLTWMRAERFNIGNDPPGKPDETFAGDVHSHPGGNRCASNADFNQWQKYAQATGYAIAGLIILAPETRWEAGMPAGGDWTNPELHGWIAWPDGDLRAAHITIEEEEDHALRLYYESHTRPRRTHAP